MFGGLIACVIFFVGFASVVGKHCKKKVVRFWVSKQKKGLLEKMLPPHVKLTHVGVIFYVMKGHIHVLKEANGPPLMTIYF
jgi:hypothetical protein